MNVLSYRTDFKEKTSGKIVQLTNESLPVRQVRRSIEDHKAVRDWDEMILDHLVVTCINAVIKQAC